MQSRPADQLHGVLLQVKITGENGFDVTLVLTLLHRGAQLDHTTKLIAATVFGVSQYELGVVLGGHRSNLRRGAGASCEPEHKKTVCAGEFP